MKTWSSAKQGLYRTLQPGSPVAPSGFSPSTVAIAAVLSGALFLVTGLAVGMWTAAHMQALHIPDRTPAETLDSGLDATPATIDSLLSPNARPKQDPIRLMLSSGTKNAVVSNTSGPLEVPESFGMVSAPTEDYVIDSRWDKAYREALEQEAEAHH